MSAALQTGALVCTALGLVGATAVLLRSRRLQPALGVLLDLLLAAALLRLADDPDWREIVTAAAVVAVRQLVRLDLRRPRPARCV